MAGHDQRYKGSMNQSMTHVITWIKVPTGARKLMLQKFRQVARLKGPTMKLTGQRRWPVVGHTGRPTRVVG